MNKHLIISCEHAGHEIPAAFRHLFANHHDVLETHRGWDIGALELAKTLANRLQITPHINLVSRLVIDFNRSLHHPALFSEFMHDIDDKEREEIVASYYHPYRDSVKQNIEAAVAKVEPVVHLSVHTFTPIMDDVIRRVDVGFLYDPKRAPEKEFCGAWRSELEKRLPKLTVRMNKPYRGVADGFTTALRKKFNATRYLGIELEVNQKFVQKNAEWQKLQHIVAESLALVLIK